MADAHGDLRIEGVTKRFGPFLAVDDLTLTVPRGSFFALLGPSGCGKTTTLRMVAGLEEPTAGRILLGEEDITSRKPYRRPVNTVFQSYALFPHLDISENVAFGLRRRRQRDVAAKVAEALALVELTPLARRRPAQLSGGQQQRVALARAIVNRPEVLLLDEPLGALDLKLRRQMQLELKRIQTEVGLTFVHVTHDQEEAMTMADTIAVMHLGRVEQLGAPAELYEHPATAFVANFLGQSNLVRATVTGRSGGDLLLEVGGRRVVLPVARSRVPGGGADGSTVLLGVRPEKIRAVPAGQQGVPGEESGAVDVLPDGVVVDASFSGVSTQYVVRMPFGADLVVFAQNLGTAGLLPVGSTVDLRWDPRHSFGLPGDDDPTAGAEVDPDLAPARAGG